MIDQMKRNSNLVRNVTLDLSKISARTLRNESSCEDIGRFKLQVVGDVESENPKEISDKSLYR